MGECVAPFQLHAEWPVLALGELCAQGGGDVQTGPFGSQLHKSDYVEIGIPSVMPVNIGDNSINTEGIARITEEDAKRLSRYRLKAGDIVYSRRGDVERRALVRTREEGWLWGTGCFLPAKNALHQMLLAAYLDHNQATNLAFLVLAAEHLNVHGKVILSFSDLDPVDEFTAKITEKGWVIAPKSMIPRPDDGQKWFAFILSREADE